MRTAIFWLCLLILLPTGTALALEASESPNAHPLPVGSTMPDLQLMGKISPELLATLGLQGNEPYPLSNIKAKTIILVAFSMYCPHCQREAPALNELSTLIKTKGLDKDIKMIGVGIGNSDFEVNVFREKYAVTYPLFSDPDFVTNKAIGEVGTPYFYVLNMDPKNKEIKVAHTLLGRMESVEGYLDQVVKVSAK